MWPWPQLIFQCNLTALTQEYAYQISDNNMNTVLHLLKIIPNDPTTNNLHPFHKPEHVQYIYSSSTSACYLIMT